MIGKVLQNNNFKETTRYVLDKQEARLLGSTVMGDSAESISQEFLLSRDLNPEIKRPVYHLIDSYSYEDAATHDLSDEFQLDLAIQHFAGLVVSSREPELLRHDDKTAYKQKVDHFVETELYEYQWFCASHEDTKHKHTHFVASRINLVDGRCIPTWQDQERSHRICREIEKEQGLQPLQSFYETERRSPTRGQLVEWEKSGIPPVMVVMQDAIDQEAMPGRSLEEVTTALMENHGIETIRGLYKGKPGVVFSMEDRHGESVRMSGSQLGRGYTLPALQDRLERDIEIALPDVEPELEQSEPDPLEAVLRVQADYAQHLTPLIKEIWEREKAGSPNLETVDFEDYQIRVHEQGQPELWRSSRKLLEYSDKTYFSNGLTQTDVERLMAWQQLMTQLDEAQEKKTGKEQEQQTTIQPEKSKEKSKGLER